MHAAFIQEEIVLVGLKGFHKFAGYAINLIIYTYA